MKKFHSVLNNLHRLRDSGNFREFNSVADRVLLTNKGDDELEILILIEKSVVVSYQNDLEKAEMMVQEALDTLSKSKVKERCSTSWYLWQIYTLPAFTDDRTSTEMHTPKLQVLIRTRKE